MEASSKIFLIDDHPAMLGGLRALLSGIPEWTICGEASTAKDAMKLIPLRKPDLVVTDIRLSDQSGIEMIRELLKKQEQLKILVFSAYPEYSYAERTLRSGGRGYLSKSKNGAEVIHAIRQILKGRIYVDTETCTYLRESFGDFITRAGSSTMSHLDWRIFQEIGKGTSNAEIGAKLGMTAREVSAKRIEIRTQLGIDEPGRLRSEAMLWTEIFRLSDRELS